MLSGITTRIATSISIVAISVCLLHGPAIAPALADDMMDDAATSVPSNKSQTVDTAAVKSVSTPEELERWMEFYYLHPQPDLLPQAIHFADSSGLVSKGEAPLTSFLSRVFFQNSKRIPQWVGELGDLSPAAKPMLWSALWWSNTIEGKEQLNKLATSLPSKRDQDAVLSQMSKPSTAVETMELNRPEVLDELWGAFSATGDEKYVNRLISTLPWMTDNGGDYIKLTIAGAAKWSLISNAQVHPKVMACLMKARQQQPNMRKTLDAMIAEATKPTTSGPQASTRTPQ